MYFPPFKPHLPSKLLWFLYSKCLLPLSDPTWAWRWACQPLEVGVGGGVGRGVKGTCLRPGGRPCHDTLSIPPLLFVWTRLSFCSSLPSVLYHRHTLYHLLARWLCPYYLIFSLSLSRFSCYTLFSRFPDFTCRHFVTSQWPLTSAVFDLGSDSGCSLVGISDL